VPGKTQNDYLIDHSAGMYLFDQAGKVRVYIPYGQKPADIANDIQTLL
jgi:protein SCO1/2